MNGVRLVAGIFFVIGWITLIVGGFLTLTILLTVLAAAAALGVQGLNAALAASAGSLALVIALALGPFTVWAILHGLCELHAQGERALDLLDGLRRSSHSLSSTPTPAPRTTEATAPTPRWVPPAGQTGLTQCPRCKDWVPARVPSCPLCGASIS
jgi:hypothetical protein